MTQDNLDILCRQIEQAAKEEAESIISQARQKAEALQAEALEKAKKQKQAYKKEKAKWRQEEEKKLLSYLKLEEKRAKLALQKELWEKALAWAEEEKEKLEKSHVYKEVLKKLAQEAVLALQKETVKIRISSRSQKTLGDNFAEELEVYLKKTAAFLQKAEVVFDSSISDIGLIVEAEAGRVIFDNTFSQRQRQLYNEIRNMVYERIAEF